MSTWSVGQFSIRTKNGERTEVKGLVASEAPLGIHTDPVSRQLHLTILSGPHAGHRYGPPFQELAELLEYAEVLSDV